MLASTSPLHPSINTKPNKRDYPRTIAASLLIYPQCGSSSYIQLVLVLGLHRLYETAHCNSGPAAAKEISERLSYGHRYCRSVFPAPRRSVRFGSMSWYPGIDFPRLRMR